MQCARPGEYTTSRLKGRHHGYVCTFRLDSAIDLGAAPPDFRVASIIVWDRGIETEGTIQSVGRARSTYCVPRSRGPLWWGLPALWFVFTIRLRAAVGARLTRPFFDRADCRAIAERSGHVFHNRAEGPTGRTPFGPEIHGHRHARPRGPVMKVLLQSIFMAGVLVVAACSSDSKRVGYSEERIASIGAFGGDVVTFRVTGMMKTKSGAT